jgi:hypothetical protein
MSFNGDNYLIYASDTPAGRSRLYKFNSSDLFDMIQELSTGGAYDWEFILPQSGTERYIALANYNEAVQPSRMYRWTGSQFQSIQVIPTQGAADVQHFVIGSTDYLAICNQFINGASSNQWDVNVGIWRLSGSSVVPVQNLSATGANDAEFFTINNEYYIAVAEKQGTQSRIWKWNGSQFVIFQSIATTVNAANDWEFFTVNGENFMALANVFDSVQGFAVKSRIFRWEGVLGFSEVAQITTSGATDWEVGVIDGQKYLFVSNSNDASSSQIDSALYRLW